MRMDNEKIPDMSGKSLRANLMLLLTAALWGGGFVAQRLGMQEMGPYLFNGIRFFLGALVLVPFLLFRKDAQRNAPDHWRGPILVGMAAGVLLFIGATLQQLGLVYTTAGKAGFITGLYVIIVPLLGMLWGDRAPFNTWVGVLLALTGMYLLSATEGLRLAPGDGYVLTGALFWAMHVQLMAKYAPRIDPFKLSFVQSLFTALVSFLVGLRVEGLVMEEVKDSLWPILYGGVISIGVAYTLQIVGQQSARPTPAAIILSLESVFAALLGWLILGEGLTLRSLAGCGLMLLGMVLAQIPPRLRAGQVGSM